ncbi:MAG: hypothetical protein ACSLEN_14405 [Candidatus Malihini olakiniferum]
MVFLLTPIIVYVLAVMLWMFATLKSYQEVNDYAYMLTAPSEEPEEVLTFKEQLAETKQVLANHNILLTVIGAGLIIFSQTVGLWFLAPHVVFTLH